MTTLAQLLKYKLIAIIRGAQPADVINIAEALFSGGIRCLEITLNSPEALKVIESIGRHLGDRVLVGAGTVLDVVSANAAVAAGAKFIISPITDTKTISRTKELGAISIPGAFTPTEIFKAHSAGGDIIKIFPGTQGPAFIKEILAPFPQIPLMPTGGISLQNIEQFKRAGAVAFGIGKSLVDTTLQINEACLQDITLKAQKFVEAVKG